MPSIVLFEPEIPPNTGNIIRLASNTGCDLHLIKPLGFELDDKRLRRAGLDYHEFATLVIHDSWSTFVEHAGSCRLIACSTKGKTRYDQYRYSEEDFLIFGPETRGLPEDVLDAGELHEVVRIPMLAESRSLNLSNSVAILVFEAWRQLGFPAGR